MGEDVIDPWHSGQSIGYRYEGMLYDCDGLDLDIEPLAVQFQLPRFVIYQTICEVLEGDSRVTEAAECFRRMQSELATDTTIHDERAQWEFGEWFPEQYCQSSFERSTQVLNSDAQRG
jgi:hypothetical protein